MFSLQSSPSACLWMFLRWNLLTNVLSRWSQCPWMVLYTSAWLWKVHALNVIWAVNCFSNCLKNSLCCSLKILLWFIAWVEVLLTVGIVVTSVVRVITQNILATECCCNQHACTKCYLSSYLLQQFCPKNCAAVWKYWCDCKNLFFIIGTDHLTQFTHV